MVGALDYTLEEIVNCHRIANGQIYENDIKTMNPTLDLGNSYWGSLDDDRPRPDIPEDENEESKDEDEDEGDVDKISLIPPEEVGTRQLRLCKKLNITEGYIL